MSRILHFVAILVLVVAGAAIATVLAFRVWLRTDGGERWMRAQVNRYARPLGLEVGFRRMKGSLVDDAVLEGVTVRSRGLRVYAPRVALDWSIASVLDRHPKLRARLERPSIRLSGVPAVRLPKTVPYVKGVTLDATVDDGELQLGPERRPLRATLHTVIDQHEGAARGQLRWGRDRARFDGTYRDGRVKLALTHLAMTPPFGVRAYLPSWIGTPSQPLTGELRVRGRLAHLRLAGAFTVGRGSTRGRLRVRGRGSLWARRADLRIVFSHLQPDLLPSEDQMVLSGSARVALRGPRTRFVVDGRYSHRPYDPSMNALMPQSTGGGTLRGRGSARLGRSIRARFAIRVRDAGRAARLVSPDKSRPAREVLLRGAYLKRPARPPALQLHTEAVR